MPFRTVTTSCSCDDGWVRDFFWNIHICKKCGGTGSVSHEEFVTDSQLEAEKKDKEERDFYNSSSESKERERQAQISSRFGEP